MYLHIPIPSYIPKINTPTQTLKNEKNLWGAKSREAILLLFINMLLLSDPNRNDFGMLFKYYPFLYFF
jgi:hypothetical protein